MNPVWNGISDDRRAAIQDAVGHILARVDAEIAVRQPICNASGRCCHFEKYGHRLYVTTVELFYFALMQETADAGNGPSATGKIPLPQYFAGKVEGCPYQINNLCTARAARPLGCRIYFCDPQAQHWQNDVYEKFHAELKALHNPEESDPLAYHYVEWRAGLQSYVSQS